MIRDDATYRARSPTFDGYGDWTVSAVGWTVTGLLASALLGLVLWAPLPGLQFPSMREAISTDRAPAALGPYSQAVVAGGLVFVSGTAGIDPATGQVADGIEAQTDQALRNIAAILEAAGSSMADLVKTTIFYSDVDDFAALNAVYARHMPDPPPARSAPANVRLPRGLLVSIEAVALHPQP